MRKVGKNYLGLVSQFSTEAPGLCCPRSQAPGSPGAGWQAAALDGKELVKVLTVRPPPGLGTPAGDYWTCSWVDFKRVTAASLSCGPPSLPRCRALHPELAERGRRPLDLGQQAAVRDSRTPQGHRRALRPPPPQVWRATTKLHAKAPSTDFATLCSPAKGTHLAMFDRSRCFCTSSRTSRKKRRRFSSNCWHCSNTCSMLSMYCGVPWPSSFRDFSYFSLLYDRGQVRE